MRRAAGYWKEIGVAVGAVVLNGLFLLQFVGVSYEPFSWKAFAQVYGPPGGADTDGDGIPDANDPRPTIADPSGCFYELGTGQIIPGGSVIPSQPGATITEVLDGSTGCYQFFTNMTGTIDLTFIPPPGCFIARTEDCPNLGELVAMQAVESPGNPEDAGNPGFLTSGDCTPYYDQITLSALDFAVINNNIPLVCGTSPAPALSPWGWLAAGLLLTTLAFFGLRRREVRVRT